MQDHIGRPGPDQSRPENAHALVVVAPSHAGDQMSVQLVGWPESGAYEIPGNRWMPRANPSLDSAGGSAAPLIPVRGDHCLVQFDHIGDGWVTAWG